MRGAPGPSSAASRLAEPTASPRSAGAAPRLARVFDGGWDAGLDEAQLAAACHGGGPLVIVAGAGTGKTRTVTARVARLLADGVDPARILLLTFTRRAAADMLARAAVLCGDRRAATRLWGGTFHAVAHRLLSVHAETLGLPARLSVLDQADARGFDGPAAARSRPGRHDRAVSSRGHPGRRVLPGGEHRPTGPGGDRRAVPVVRPPHRGHPRLVPRLHRPQTGRRPAGLRRPAAGLAHPAHRPHRRTDARRPVGSRAGRRVPGRQPGPGRHRPAAAPGRRRV